MGFAVCETPILDMCRPAPPLYMCLSVCRYFHLINFKFSGSQWRKKKQAKKASKRASNVKPTSQGEGANEVCTGLNCCCLCRCVAPLFHLDESQLHHTQPTPPTHSPSHWGSRSLLIDFLVFGKQVKSLYVSLSVCRSVLQLKYKNQTHTMGNNDHLKQSSWSW